MADKGTAVTTPFVAVSATAPTKPDKFRVPPSLAARPGAYALLHRELLEHAALNKPTDTELEDVERVRARVQEAAGEAVTQKLGPGSWVPRAELFGSYAYGCAGHGSDIDVSLVGLPIPPSITKHDEGYMRQCEVLQKVLDQLQNDIVPGSADNEVIKARVPIIRVHLFSGARCFQVDVSAGNGNGPQGARLIRGLLHLLPPLRPLMLVVKRLLKEANCGDAAGRGMSSYSATMLVSLQTCVERATAAQLCVSQ